MANPVSVTTAELSIVAAIGRAVRANSVKVTKQADTSLAIAAVITPSRPGGRMWITWPFRPALAALLAFGAYAHDQFSPGWPGGTRLRSSAPIWGGGR